MRESKEGNSLTGWAAGQRRERMVLNHDQSLKRKSTTWGAGLSEEEMEPPARSRDHAGNLTDAKASRGLE